MIQLSNQKLIHLIRSMTRGLVAHDLKQAWCSFCLQWKHQSAAPQSRPILAHMPTFVFRPALTQRRRNFVFRLTCFSVFGRKDNSTILADDLDILKAEEPFRPRIPGCYNALQIFANNRVV